MDSHKVRPMRAESGVLAGPFFIDGLDAEWMETTEKSQADVFSDKRIEIVSGIIKQHGWPAIILLVIGLFLWQYGIPMAQRVVDSHLLTLEEMRESSKQTSKTLIILEERDRKRDQEMSQVVNLMEKILERGYGSASNGQ